MVAEHIGGARAARLEQALSSTYWRDDDAGIVLDAWVESGESMAMFARKHGLQRARLYRWRQRLMPEAAAPTDAAVTFWPVVGAVPEKPAASDGAWRVELPDGVTITVPCAGGTALLAQTLAAVQESWTC